MSSFRGALPLLFVALCAVAAGCRTPGTRPHEMSEAGHEAAAKEAERKSAEHAAAYSPEAKVETWHCDREGPCWSSLENPTEVHRAEARRYAKIAAEHRAASRALRDAEARACSGVPERDRVLSPFQHHEDLLETKPLRIRGSHTVPTRLVGAVVAFRALPGLTQESLQRIIDCHRARNTVLGFDLPEMASCPLALRDVTARVRSGKDRLLVEIRSDDPRTAAEILKRALRLAAGHGSRGARAGTSS